LSYLLYTTINDGRIPEAWLVLVCRIITHPGHDADPSAPTVSCPSCRFWTGVPETSGCDTVFDACSHALCLSLFLAYRSEFNYSWLIAPLRCSARVPSSKKYPGQSTERWSNFGPMDERLFCVLRYTTNEFTTVPHTPASACAVMDRLDYCDFCTSILLFIGLASQNLGRSRVRVRQGMSIRPFCLSQTIA
jgi:hypothetical protein